MPRQAGTSNWTKGELEHLLSILEVILPLSPADWEEVKLRFDAKFSKNQRAVAALQRKFTSLHRTKEPTGNPDIPSPVRIAKRIRDMIDEKTDGTRGSPGESELDGGPFDLNDEEEDDDDVVIDNIGGTTAMDNNDNESVTALTRNAIQELARLGGHADKPFFEPIVQVVHLRKKPSSQFYDVHLSDGMQYMLGTCGEAVSALVAEEYFTLFSFIKVQEFVTTTLADGTKKSCQLLQVENTMIPNPGQKIGNPTNISQPRSSRPTSPLPTSIEFGRALRGMRIGSSAKKSGSGGGGGGGGGDDFNNIMRMMLMQQQSDREQRIADRADRIFLAEQEKLAREERARQQQLEREERANQAREDRAQQQQFMNMMMMQMVGGGKKRAREESDDEDKTTTTTPRKSPRKNK